MFRLDCTIQLAGIYLSSDWVTLTVVLDWIGAQQVRENARSFREIPRPDDELWSHACVAGSLLSKYG